MAKQEKEEEEKEEEDVCELQAGDQRFTDLHRIGYIPFFLKIK